MMNLGSKLKIDMEREGTVNSLLKKGQRTFENKMERFMEIRQGSY